jgi:nitrogenase subunit NifH
MAEDLKVNFLGDIFLDAKINQANDDRNPICNSSPSDKISFEFGKIAENILDFI